MFILIWGKRGPCTTRTFREHQIVNKPAYHPTLVQFGTQYMMKTLASMLFLFAFLVLSVHAFDLGWWPPQTHDPCSTPALNTCTFYHDCLEDRYYHCGKTGYPLHYGQHYCETFAAVKPRLSSKGQKWLSDTMFCLQDALVPEAIHSKEAVNGCEALMDKAFGTHERCYVDSGLCSLWPTDWVVIVRTVGVGTLFSNRDALKATFGAAGECLLRWSRLK